MAKEVLDHTAIIQTILERFRPEAFGMMGTRVAASGHLGALLRLDAPRVAVASAPEMPEPIEESLEALSPEERAEIQREDEASRQADALRGWRVRTCWKSFRHPTTPLRMSCSWDWRPLQAN